MAIAPRRQAQQRQGSHERRKLMQGAALHQQQQSGRCLSGFGARERHWPFLLVARRIECRRTHTYSDGGFERPGSHSGEFFKREVPTAYNLNRPARHPGMQGRRGNRKSDVIPLMKNDKTPAATAKSNGIDIAYDTFGARSSEPMVLIMGLAAQMIAWDEAFCAQLADRGFWVVRFDNRDIGLSTRLQQFLVPDLASLVKQQLLGVPVAAPYTLRDMAADTVGLMDA